MSKWITLAEAAEKYGVVKSVILHHAYRNKVATKLENREVTVTRKMRTRVIDMEALDKIMRERETYE